MPDNAKDDPTIRLDDPKYYISREISQLEFQRRVLEEAEDPNRRLLERLKFVSIVGSNMDEFFMVRVSGLRKQYEGGVVSLSIDGQTPADQLAAIRKKALHILMRSQECLQTSLLPLLKEAGIHLLNYNQLTSRQKEVVKKYFEDVIFPVTTPLAVDPGHPFPHISNLSLNLAVTLRTKQGKERFVRIKVPNTLPRLVPIKRSSGSARKDGTTPRNHYFVWLDQVIAAYVESFFPGLKVMEVHPFRVIRDADLEIQELEAADLLETMEQSVRQRRFGSVISLAVNPGMPAVIRNILVENLEMDRNDIYVLDGPLGLSDLMSLYGIDRFDLKDPPFVPAVARTLENHILNGDIFAAIRAGDILLHHPYDSFNPVVEYLRAAACDPDVLAIKQTLYRVGRKPPVVDALLEAAENGKQVAVLVELKARFDEESNIGWARKLEAAGVHVVYGLLGLKTHSKVALVIRKEGDGIRRYLHLATGNYNAVTAQLYEDMGMFTCDEEIGSDATDLFNYLTGYSEKVNYRKLFVAPVNLRTSLEALIQREIEHQRKHKSGRLIFKVNAVVDGPMIELLYKASQAGVKIDLLVRGMCCLRPGIPDVSENITVTSVVGRFLEHSRAYYFYNDGKPEIYLGSADLMPRNIDRRVEVLFPVQNPKWIEHIYENILLVYLKDNLQARRMNPDGSYTRLRPSDGEEPLSSQDWFLQQRIKR